MWLSLYFPSLNATMDEHKVIYSASPYGMPLVVHHVDATSQAGAKADSLAKSETFNA
ncbi:hypothetical protein [Vibrio casei]|uniref:hypothetical protein n=1 Tax=Vibrio casei TaxID=673372 RepID=UPI003F96FA21